MPRRTNQFQDVVNYIAEKLAPLDSKVTPSAMLEEVGTGTKREVDALLEVKAGLTTVLVAVESRDRSRKDDVEWIDCLIGKYQLLPVDKVIAVSKSGFSAAAKAKAQHHGRVELMTPIDVSSEDWPAKFMKLGMAAVELSFNLGPVSFSTDPPLKRAITRDDLIVEHETGDGAHERGTVMQFLMEMRPHLIAMARSHLNQHFLEIYKTLEDLDKVAQVSGELPTKSLNLIIGQQTVRIMSMQWRIDVFAKHAPVIVRHSCLAGAAMLSSATIHDVDLVVAQPATAQQAKVFVESRKPIAKNLGKKADKRQAKK